MSPTERDALNAYIHELRLQIATRDERVPNWPPPYRKTIDDTTERVEHQRRVVREARTRYGHRRGKIP